MSLESLFHAVQQTHLATAVRESELMYPIIMIMHLASIAFFGGMILMTDLRLLGLTLRAVPAAELIRQLRYWKWAGFTLMVTCGILLASSKADTYYPNPYFRIKISLLALVGVHALIFRRSVYRNPHLDRSVAMPRAARAAACLSLVLWLGILSAGRWIAYYDLVEHPSEAAEIRLSYGD
jgi:hypothetical protein